MTVRPGTVYLVGAGPGDPSLITVRGLELLARADVVLHDRLVSEALLEQASPSAELIDIGKTPWRETTTQETINARLVEQALRGRAVVRLKGGDPFVFGRGWEEQQACLAAGVPCEVVPGISSSIAGPAAAGIPVTSRGAASSFVVIAGHGISDTEVESAVYADTAVFLMGVRGLDELARRLIARGRNAATPAAVVERATLPGQRVVRARLDEIASVAVIAGVESPAVIVVGPTAAFGVEPTGPLSGRRVVVTRPLNASQQLTNELRSLGADVIAAPLIGLALLDGVQTNVLGRIRDFDWVVFSSRHGVRGFRRVAERNGLDARVLSHARVASVGPVTARELTAWGIRADLVAEPARADVLVHELLEHGASPSRVLFPCGTLALDSIPDGLEAHGVLVERLVVYETRKHEPDERVLRLVNAGVDAILFASPSAVEAFGAASPDVGAAHIICIGPTTAAATARFGWQNVRVADVHSDSGLVTTTVAALSSLAAAA